MDRLRDLDAIAYVRFASVYREFGDVEAMRALLDALGVRPPTSGRAAAAARWARSSRPPLSRLHPAAPNLRTRTRRPVRPVQAPVSLAEEPAPREQARRRRKA